MQNEQCQFEFTQLLQQPYIFIQLYIASCGVNFRLSWPKCSSFFYYISIDVSALRVFVSARVKNHVYFSIRICFLYITLTSYYLFYILFYLNNHFSFFFLLSSYREKKLEHLHQYLYNKKSITFQLARIIVHLHQAM